MLLLGDSPFRFFHSCLLHRLSQGSVGNTQELAGA